MPRNSSNITCTAPANPTRTPTQQHTRQHRQTPPQPSSHSNAARASHSHLTAKAEHFPAHHPANAPQRPPEQHTKKLPKPDSDLKEQISSRPNREQTALGSTGDKTLPGGDTASSAGQTN
jgi:hypothetical protein